MALGVGAVLGEDAAQVNLAGLGFAVGLLAAPSFQLLGHHRHARAIGAHIENGRVGGAGLGFAFLPGLGAGAHALNHALNLPRRNGDAAGPLQMLLGFLKPDKGMIKVAGENICGFNERELQEIRRKVTMVFQNGALFDSITVGENVAFPMRERGEMAEDQILQVVKGLLEMVGVAGMENLLPSDLSTGMKRSVAIARALAEEPEAILFDEPTTMVDPLMAGHVSELIRKLKEKFHKTAIVVTHDTHLAKKLADRVIFLQEGRVAFFGTWPELEKSNDPFLRNFLLQDELIPALDATA